MTSRTVNGSIKIREKHKIFKETGSPFDATPIHSIKVSYDCAQTAGVSRIDWHSQADVQGSNA